MNAATSTNTATATVSPLARRVVLGLALLAAFAVALPQRTSPALAQPAAVAAEPGGAAKADATAPGSGARPDAASPSDGPKARITIDASPPGAAGGAKARITVDASPGTAATPAGDEPPRSIVIEKDGRKVKVLGIHGDGEFDSFNELLSREPWIGALIFFSVAMVFLLPLLLVLAIVWYKMRKNRMLNETMLKLAEKGVVPPGDALDAIAGDSVRAAPASAALFERAREVRKCTAWSDLRKGVVMGAFGLALSLYSLLDDGSPNGFGLVLLFVGIGYVVLWWLEDRAVANVRAGSGDAPPAGP
jgi:hypothetical protein